jgi:hypothetical protein
MHGVPMHKETVPNRSVGGCLDPELPGTDLETRAGRREGEAEAGEGPPIRSGEDQLESSRDGGNMIQDCEKPIWDMMQQSQRPTA